MFGAATSDLDRLLTRLLVGARLLGALVAAAVAVIGLAPPARASWVLPAAAGLLLWGGLSAALVVRFGRRPLLAAADLMVVVALLLIRDQLLPAAALLASAGTGWIDIVAGTGVCSAQWGLRQPYGWLGGLAIAGASAVAMPGSWEAPVVLVVTTLLAAGATTVLRREAVANDLARAEEVEVRLGAAARAAARADERDQQRRLHDTVLATLTMVNTGSIGRDSVALRRRAEHDLAVIAGLRSSAAPADAPARIDHVLEAVVAAFTRAEPGVDTVLEAHALEVPRNVADAVGLSVGEALSNVARHANTAAARIVARRDSSTVRVAVRDDGAGFEPAAVPAHRRGLRESIHGRMRAVGGDARVVSRPGAGTTVELWWPAGESSG